MTELYYQDRIKDLRMLISSQLLKYLYEEEDRSKLRSKLLSYMREYLCSVPHDNKFHLPQTSQILKRSVTARAAFSGDGASRAWRALARYAENLMRQPWRKEFREIKLYCGFYKHEIEGSLVGAELMFEAMGYVHDSDSTMILQGPIDPDQITFVSKDSMMAEVECTILQSIWDKVVKYKLTWAEILDNREQYICTPEKLVQKLIYDTMMRRYRTSQNNHQPQMSYPGYYEGPPVPQPNPHLMRQSMPYPAYNQIMAPNNHYCSYNQVLQTQVLKPHDYYPPTNGYPMHLPRHTNHNGYGGHCSSYPTTVPTGQLIELNTSPVHQYHSNYYPSELLERPEIPSSRAKDDGAGSWENWNEVYKKIENSNGEKQVSERMRSMSLNRAATPPLTTVRSDGKVRTDGDGASRHRLSKNSIDLEDAFQPKARLNKHTSESETESLKPRRNTEYEKPNKSEAEQKTYENQTKPTEQLVQANDDKKPELKLADLRPTRNFVTLDVSPKFTEETSKNFDATTEGKWECYGCTFLNVSTIKICEMCGKSKFSEEIPPQPCGGSECAQCTFVNESGKNYCSACSYSLKNSSTYI